MKKFLALLLALSMVLSLTVVPASADDKFTISAERVSAATGDTVKLNLKVDNNPGFTGLALRVYYKTSLLSCTTASYTKGADDKPTAWKNFADKLDSDESQVASVLANKNDTKNLSEERKNAGWALASFG